MASLRQSLKLGSIAVLLVPSGNPRLTRKPSIYIFMAATNELKIDGLAPLAQLVRARILYIRGYWFNSNTEYAIFRIIVKDDYENT